ncbi:MAG: hypothetical protein P8170_04190 [Gemmatimonadota bacterium]
MEPTGFHGGIVDVSIVGKATSSRGQDVSLIPGTVAEVAPQGRRRRTWHGAVGYLLALLTLFALPLIAGAVLTPGAFHGDYYDPDSYTRLLRVRDLLTGGAWFDPVLERANTPYGLRLHWTRPMDLGLLAVAFPARIFFGIHR